MEKSGILIVEDDSILAVELSATLVNLGYTMLGCAKTGREAVEEAEKLKPDLILMDIELKGPMSGIEAARIIQDTLRIPVVYLTGNSDIETVKKAGDTLNFGYLLKPVESISLYSAIESALLRNELRKELLENNEKLSAILSSSPDGIILIDDSGRITEWNKAMELRTGLAHETVSGSFIWDIQFGLIDNVKLKKVTLEDTKAIYVNMLESSSDDIQNKYLRGAIKLPDGSKKILEDIIFYVITSSSRMLCIIQRDITSRIEIEEALEIEERYKSITHSYKTVTFRSRIEDFHPIYIDGSLYDLSGYTEDELVNGLIPWKKTIYEEDLGEFTSKMKNLTMDKIDSLKHDFRFNHRDGSVRWVHIIIKLVTAYDGAEKFLQGIAFDITDRKLTEKALRESEERYRTLFNQVPVGVFQYDRDLFIVECNESFSDMVKTPVKLLIGVDSSILEDQSIPVKMREALEGKDTIWEGWFNVPGSDYKVYHIARYSPLRDSSGKITGGIAVILDNTERKIVEENHKAMEARIRQAQKLESLGVMAGGIAHDFNNLLMVIMGNIELATNYGAIPPESMGNLNEAVKATHRAAELCRQMLAYSGKGKFTSELLDLNDIIKDMIQMLSLSISKKSKLQYDFMEELSTVEADVTQIQQVIMNLVINASDASGDKGGTINIKTGTMNCESSFFNKFWFREELPSGNYVYLQVTDSGSGIEKGNIQNIFDPFYTTKFTGRGLGLSAVLGIVRGHSGAIKVESEVGKGTSFMVFLPVSTNGSDLTSKSEHAPGEWHGAGTVLIVDDEDSILKVAEKMFLILGYEVLTVNDGKKAISVFENNIDYITCIVLDLTMPVMDGEEALKEIRKLSPSVPVILTTGYNELDVSGRFESLGLSGFIQKPYKINNVIEILKGIFG